MKRVLLVGAGIMGSNHARVLRSIEGVEIAGVVDLDESRRMAVASPSGAETFRSVDEVPVGFCELAIVATPTGQHHSDATKLLAMGIHTLIEKPLTTTLDEARELANIAEQQRLKVSVGHIERFNPVVREILRIADKPIHVEARRIGPFSARIRESVVSDLMIHDLDIVSLLAQSTHKRVVASARSVRTSFHDIATVIIEFQSGMTAALTASRLGQQKIREISVTQPENTLSGDLLRQDLVATKVSQTEFISDDGVRYRQTASIEVPFLENTGEPLRLELLDFLDSIANDRRPTVGISDGMRALELVEEISRVLRHDSEGL